ncbi:NAD-dependent protein deacylase [Pisciglobus halotolerans]|uniref:protein acetyllysine N-acetyltransferase n=1 Tax=Pisciglobus halotolerans TaxID=745365 RepID=A0A1I3AYB7_9LACT|nr:NAD-dependent protein deacylase [Pisciglobus halotolerans]SFH54806.1 NAD-dependent deacetylase [Pisciglobus halotolerans]
MKTKKIEKIQQYLKSAQKIAVITGAGISTGSGIPDFRSSGGVYDQLSGINYSGAEALSDTFLASQPDLFYHNFMKHIYYPNAKPNDGHRFLKKLEDEGHKVTIITQNIDGLHQKAGSSAVYELHGSALRFRLPSGQKVSYQEIEVQDEKPYYNEQLVRPDIVLYGEMLDEALLFKSIKAVAEAGLLLVIGTSLEVYPAAGLPNYFDGDLSVLITKAPTPLDREFSIVLHEDINEVIKELESK